jgi:MFS transporter, MHS family, citrate/tricarballylate:H+ symporter
VLALITAYPALSWLAIAPTFAKMLMVELWLSFIYASYNGAMIVALTEVMPIGVRTSGFSLAYSLATTFGGFTAAVCTWLIATTGDNAAPGYWMSAAALCGLAGTYIVYRSQERVSPAAVNSAGTVIGA